MKIATVLRSGGDFKPEHVRRLRDQLDTVGCFEEMICLTDMDVDYEGVRAVPFWFDFPGWWSKLELFRPGIGDVLYMDLDTTIVRPIGDLLQPRDTPVVLRDFYKLGEKIGSGLMYVREDNVGEVWARWTEKPDWYMENTRRGDQGFLESIWGPYALRWQDVLPGRVVSYKVHVRPTGKIPAEASIVCHHGIPRPWSV